MVNLRVALSSLRKRVAPYLVITRETVSLNPEAAVWLDLAELLEKLSTGQIEEAVAVYQGDFLEGCYVRGGSGCARGIHSSQRIVSANLREGDASPIPGSVWTVDLLFYPCRASGGAGIVGTAPTAFRASTKR